MAYRRGIGDRLAEGSYRLAAGPAGHPEFSMTVKKLEIPGYDPRASFTQALGYMTSPTGACHLRGGYAVSLAFFGGTKEIPRFSLLQSPIAIRNMQNTGILQDSLGVCRFTGFAFVFGPLGPDGQRRHGARFLRGQARGDREPHRDPGKAVQLEAGATAEDDVLPGPIRRTPDRRPRARSGVSRRGPGADAARLLPRPGLGRAGEADAGRFSAPSASKRGAR